MGVNCKIKKSEIYFDEKCDLTACAKTTDDNVHLSFYLYLKHNDSYPISNLILNQIQTLFLTRDGTLAL
jgi:hypothetical protein